jgi:hypothetical protein
MQLSCNVIRAITCNMATGHWTTEARLAPGTVHRSLLPAWSQSAAAGALPSFSWVNPRWFVNKTSAEGANDNHPDHDVRLGEALVKEVRLSTMNNPLLHCAPRTGRCAKRCVLLMPCACAAWLCRPGLRRASCVTQVELDAIYHHVRCTARCHTALIARRRLAVIRCRL